MGSWDFPGLRKQCVIFRKPLRVNNCFVLVPERKGTRFPYRCSVAGPLVLKHPQASSTSLSGGSSRPLGLLDSTLRGPSACGLLLTEPSRALCTLKSETYHRDHQSVI